MFLTDSDSFIHPSIHYLHSLSFNGHRNKLKPILTDSEWQWGTPWAGRQYIAGLTHTHIYGHIYLK